MEPSVERINSVLRPAMRNRLGTQANVYGAKAIAQRDWGTTSLSAGQLAYALVLEVAYWTDNNVKDVFIPEDALNDSVVQMVWSICSRADSSHSKGSKAVAGAAIGMNFGVLGALVGAAFGWAVGQSAANNDLQSVVMYAGQAIDYMCDVFCEKTRAFLYSGNKSIAQKKPTYLVSKRDDGFWQIKVIDSNKVVKVFNNREDAINFVNKMTNNQSDAYKIQEPKEEKKEAKKGYPMFSDVIGLDEAKQAIQERIIEPAKHPEVYKKYGYKAGGGILLYGLPGTGKTMFAQAVANELDGKFFSVKASDLKAKWYGETEEKIKKLFTEARREKVSVIFIDEFEAIGMDRNKQTTDLTATTVVPELLAQMQGFEHDSENILLVIAATNRPWDIDSALTRPGRLDYKVYVELPNSECRKAMLKNYLKKVQVLDIAFNYLVEHTEGYNGADIKNVADALVKIVIKKEIDGVSNYHLDYKDAVSVLERIHSSVSKNDTYLMEIYRNNN